MGGGGGHWASGGLEDLQGCVPPRVAAACRLFLQDAGSVVLNYLLVLFLIAEVLVFASQGAEGN